MEIFNEILILRLNYSIFFILFYWYIYNELSLKFLYILFDSLFKIRNGLDKFDGVRGIFLNYFLYVFFFRFIVFIFFFYIMIF